MEKQFDNLDKHELEKFAAMADDWWNPEGDLKTLHIINPLRLKYVDDAVSVKNKDILDIGCGGGVFSEALAAAGANVTGLDANESAINVARKHADLIGHPIEYSYSTAEEFADNSGQKFDVITCMELLEHVPEPDTLLSACATLLRPGGDLFVATINRNPKSYTAAILGAEYLLGLLPKGTHDYAKFIKPSELGRWLRAINFSIVNISGMHYLPYADRCFLNNDPSVNYLLHARAPLRA